MDLPEESEREAEEIINGTERRMKESMPKTRPETRVATELTYDLIFSETDLSDFGNQ